MRRALLFSAMVLLLACSHTTWCSDGWAQTKPLRVLGVGHTQPVVAVAFGPRGTALASASLDKTIILWNARTGGVQHVFEGHSTAPRALAFSDQGKTLVSCGRIPQKIELIRWSTDSGAKLDKQVLEARDNVIAEPPTLSRDGRRLAAIVNCLGQMRVRVWDVDTGSVVREFNSRQGRHVGRLPWTVSLNPAGRLVATAENRTTVRLVSTSGDRDEKLPAPLSGVMRAVFRPDGKSIAAVIRARARTSRGYPTRVSILDLEKKQTQQEFSLGEAQLLDVVLSPDGKRLASIGNTGVKLWDTVRGALIAKLADGDRLHGQQRVAFSPDGRYLAGPNGSRVEIWDVAKIK